jgi:hypothetical protein
MGPTMPHAFSLEDPIAVSIIDSGTKPQEVHQPACPQCALTLSLHIPDPQLPDRMLAVCEDCKSWYLLDCIEGRMALLPDF